MHTIHGPTPVGHHVIGSSTMAGEWSAIAALPHWLLAVIICIGASAMTVTGFVLQKRALHEAELSPKRWPKVGEIVLSPSWIFGFLVTAIFPVLGDLLAYSLAPLSLTAPLSGVSVVLNMVIAPWILREQLQRFPDAPATVLILVGCLLTTAFGNHDHKASYGMPELLRLASRPLFIVGFVLGLCCESVVVMHQRRCRAEIERLAIEQPQNPHLPHVLLPAIAASLCGAMANIGLKAVGELLRHQSPRLQVLLCVLIVAPSATFQVNFINRGLFLYPQSVFLSVYGALLILVNTVYGAVFYEEYQPLLTSRLSLFFFICGCAMIMLGIWLFRLRQPAKSNRTHKDEELGNIAEDGVLQKRNSASNLSMSGGNEDGVCRTRTGVL